MAISPSRAQLIRKLLAATAISLVAACGGENDGGSSSSPDVPAPNPAPAPTPAPSPAPTPAPPPEPASKAFQTPTSTARFLTQATFGPTKLDVETLVGTSPSEWVLTEFGKPATLNLPLITSLMQLDGGGDEADSFFDTRTPTFAFWTNAVSASDQLRQRVAFALSEILVVSDFSDDFLEDQPRAMGYYQDILVQNAFGNYRDLLQDVTYSPAMATFLTYLGNKKANPDTGRMPDENYARELMQLFTIGLEELNLDGTPVLDGSGNPIETYDNSDITGLAKVFTGLSFACDHFDIEFELGENCDFDRETDIDEPMLIYEQFHSTDAKSFLGMTIPANTAGEESIEEALDHIFNQPSVAPFIGRQLIQRLVTSHPSGSYVRRVATAFENGSYMLPNGSIVGDGRRGDMQATIAAILFDPDAETEPDLSGNTFGKLREPVLRFTSWARAFNAGSISPEVNFRLWNTSGSDALSQHPFRSPSVFNFFRPGYVPPGTETGARGLTMPEFQLVNTSSIAGYTNFMTYFVFNQAENLGDDVIAAILEDLSIDFEPDRLRSSFIADYSTEVALATDPPALIDHLDDLLTYGTLSEESRATMVEFIETIPLTNQFDEDYDGPLLHTQLAVLILITSPDYLVQR